MIEQVKIFIERFFEAEQNLLTAYNKQDLENYNEAVDKVDLFSIDKLKYAFGAKLNQLRDDEFYERVKNWPLPQKRFLYRIDAYQIPDQGTIYTCLASRPNPRRAKVFSLFVIAEEKNELKIFSKFTFSDNGMGGPKLWFSGGGDESFEHKVGEEFMLNEAALGSKLETLKLLEPVASDEEGLKEYNKD